MISVYLLLYLWGGNPKKKHFVLLSGTLRFIFSEHFVLRIIILHDFQ